MLLKKQNNRTILLADDDEDDRGFFTDALEEVSAGDQLMIVDNGIELMALLNRNELPDILFLDLNMPMKNGYECLAEIRKSRHWEQLPIVIISTSLQPEAADRVFQQGASLYIVKPNDYQHLKGFIGKVLHLHKTERLLHPSRENFILKS